MMTAVMNETISAQVLWAAASIGVREAMLSLIGYSKSFASTSWKKLPYMVKTNLSARVWPSTFGT